MASLVSNRFLPHTTEERHALLQACGVATMEELLVGIPEAARCAEELAVGSAHSEWELTRLLKERLKHSRTACDGLSFLGAGVYDHDCPAVVNQLTLRGEFLTSYTPYQPEMAQGTLQALYEFQSMIAELFGMEVSNASHYDGATSFAEAVLMALRIQPQKKTVVLSAGIHPEYIAVLKTYCRNVDVVFEEAPLSPQGATDLSKLSLAGDKTALVCVQSPNFYGCVEDLDSLKQHTQSYNALFGVCVTEPLSLGLFRTPGECGADIAVGEGQSFGLPPSFGGPYLGLFTAKKQYVRNMPGRLCGQTVDAEGRRSFTLTLSTREQHIRREKATSNICTNQNLCALWATIWLSLVGKGGFLELAKQNFSKAQYAKSVLLKTGKVQLRYPDAENFNEFTIDLKHSGTKEFLQACLAHNVAPGVALSRFQPNDDRGLLVAITEKKSRKDIDFLAELVQKYA